MGENQIPRAEYVMEGVSLPMGQRDSDGSFEVSDVSSIINSLPMGVVVFDIQLKVQAANAIAQNIIGPVDRLSDALQAGTGVETFNDWASILTTVLKTGQKARFDAVEFCNESETCLLDIECTALKQSGIGQITGGLAILQDVTEKINIQRQLSQAERFAAIGKVAGKVAHELNNPLDGIIRFINLALRSMDKNEKAKPKQYLKQSRQGLMRMVGIVRELLEFSRSSYLASESSAIYKVVEEAVKAMEPCAEGVEMIIVKKCPIASGRIIDGNLFQVFCNLIKNAVDAIDGQGQLEITIDRDENMAVISFSDTGPGFPVELAEDIFKPFFTTKSHGNGTGLGLAICKDMIEKYNGRITAANNPDRGSNFSVYFPL